MQRLNVGRDCSLLLLTRTQASVSEDGVDVCGQLSRFSVLVLADTRAPGVTLILILPDILLFPPCEGNHYVAGEGIQRKPRRSYGGKKGAELAESPSRIS